MDLVEIRKKAKGNKKKIVDSPEPVIDESVEKIVSQPAEEEPIAAPEVESTAETEAAVETESPEVSEPDPQEVVPDQDEAETAVADEQDPIDALFTFQLENGQVTEENYLQALVGEDEVVDHDIQQWLTFSLADEEYALTIDSVSEIIKPREVTDIPRVPDFICGIISLRGIIVPVFDLSRRLNLGLSEMESSSRIIVCQQDERLAGFLVDRINQVVNVPMANIEPPPTVLSGLDRDFVDGVGRVDGKMLILLHLSNVMNAELT